ncbi:MAG: hypothetical protein LRY51_03805, partial [Geovibrio sp.]|nr:hypothetical protein [Geovibrio sp.]
MRAASCVPPNPGIIPRLTSGNANFDDDVFVARIKETLTLRDQLSAQLTNKDGLHDAAIWTAETKEEMEAKAPFIGVLATEHEDIRSLRELIIYGLKGLAAYVNMQMLWTIK